MPIAKFLNITSFNQPQPYSISVCSFDRGPLDLFTIISSFRLDLKQLSTLLPILRPPQFSRMAQPANNDTPIRLWGGRFTGEMDPLMNQYNESLSLDRVFYAQDIKGSIAYARANVKTGILTQEEFEKLEEGLKKVLKEWDDGTFQPVPGDEGRNLSLMLLYSPF
jgi:hypothetical protein